MRTVTVDAYTFEELSGFAKDNARQIFSDVDYDLEDFKEIAEILGIDFEAQSVPLCGGKTREEPRIYWTDFYTQGAGLGYHGTYRYAKKANKKIRQHAPKDETLHAIADGLLEVQRRHFYRLRASMRSNNYSDCTIVEVWDDEDEYRDLGDDEKEVEDLLKRFGSWMYKNLQDEYEFQTSNETIEENCKNNNYLFDKRGNLL